jgi:uncharacterized protein involved in exopolysaccharide biosynthesis
MTAPNRPHDPPGSGDSPLLATPADVLVQQVRDLVLWAWTLRWWLLGACLVGGLLGVGLAKTMLNKQVANARISLLRAQLENPLGSFSRKSIRFFNAPLSAFTADSLVETTLRQLDGTSPSPRLLSEVKSDLKIVDYGNDDFEVSYSHRDGERAVGLLRVHIEAYLASEQARNLAALRREVERLEGTMASISTRMTEAERRLREFRSANALVRPEFAKENMANLRQAQAALGDLESRLADTDIELADAQRRLAAEKPELRVATTTSASGNKTRIERIDRLRMEISTLRADGLRDQHPTLARLLSEEQALTAMADAPAAAPTEISEEVRPSERHLQLTQLVEKLEVSRGQLLRQVATATRWLDQAKLIIDDLPLLEERYAELSRGQEADRKSYESIAQVLEMARLQLRLEEEAAPTRLDLYSAPRLRFTSRLVRTAALGLAGAMAGISLVVAAWGALRLRRLVWGGGFSRGAAS